MSKKESANANRTAATAKSILTLLGDMTDVMVQLAEEMEGYLVDRNPVRLERLKNLAARKEQLADEGLRDLRTMFNPQVEHGDLSRMITYLERVMSHIEQAEMMLNVLQAPADEAMRQMAGSIRECAVGLRRAIENQQKKGAQSATTQQCEQALSAVEKISSQYYASLGEICGLTATTAPTMDTLLQRTSELFRTREIYKTFFEISNEMRRSVRMFQEIAVNLP
ncbi:MAG: hypothetical protein HQL51_15255 [Magnetococcales bacterium]|nr:hypothetical protein [Magnetococcales bacterium]